MADDHHGKLEERIFVRVDRELEDLIPGYLTKRRKDIPSIISFVDKGDYEEVRVLGYSMKGSGGGYGFEAISEIGARIEAAAKEKDEQTVRNLTDELSKYLERVEVMYE